MFHRRNPADRCPDDTKPFTGRTTSVRSRRLIQAALLCRSQVSITHVSISQVPGELQRELAIRAPVAIHEIADMLGHGDTFDIASGLDFDGNGLRNVVRPMLKCVEGDNPDRIIELAGQEIGDDGFEIRPLDLGFAVDACRLR